MSKSNVAVATIFAALSLAVVAGCGSAPPSTTGDSTSAISGKGDSKPPAAHKDDGTDLASVTIPVGGGMCLIADGDCLIHVGGAAGAVTLATTDCGVTLVAAVGVLVCQVGGGGPEDPLADFCSGALASLAGQESIKCVAETLVGITAGADIKDHCVKSCSGGAA